MLSSAVPHGTRLGSWMIDVDNFKAVIDRYGPLVGDEISKASHPYTKGVGPQPRGERNQPDSEHREAGRAGALVANGSALEHPHHD
jgi:hypothetical protein